jgi:DNA-3-methyladenine glycosylase II
MFMEPDFIIKPRGPFSWDAATDVLATWAPMRRFRSEHSIVRMAFPLDEEYDPVGVALWEDRGLNGKVYGTGDVDRVRRQVSRIFSLDWDGSDYPEVGRRDPRIGRLMEQIPGLRPVEFTTPYEAAVWAVISQRIRMTHAARIQDGLIRTHGESLMVADEEVRSFPAPKRLEGVKDIAGLGLEKVRRIQGVAEAALEGRLDPYRMRELGDLKGPAELRSIRGIGPFWSEGVYLRGCGIPDVFPDEPKSLRALADVHGLVEIPQGDEMRQMTEPYIPFRMWVCFLLRVAPSRGLIRSVQGGPRQGGRTSRS